MLSSDYPRTNSPSYASRGICLRWECGLKGDRIESTSVGSTTFYWETEGSTSTWDSWDDFEATLWNACSRKMENRKLDSIGSCIWILWLNRLLGFSLSLTLPIFMRSLWLQTRLKISWIRERKSQILLQMISNLKKKFAISNITINLPNKNRIRTCWSVIIRRIKLYSFLSCTSFTYFA